MDYKGKLYGKLPMPIGYFETGVTSEEYDILVEKAKKYDALEAKVFESIEEDDDTDLCVFGEILLEAFNIH